MQAPAVHVGDQALQRLENLGLSQGPLRDAAEWAHKFHVLETTDNDPVTARGFTFWAKTVRGLRDRLMPSGWTKNVINKCFPLTMHPDGNVAIAVSGGDADTGIEVGRPTTRSTKGKATKDAVHQNQQVFEFNGVPRIQKTKGLATWVLLIHEDLDIEEVRLELSLPSKVNKENYVDEWLERIILPSIPFGDLSGMAAPGEPIAPSSTEVIEIEVQRRADS